MNSLVWEAKNIEPISQFYQKGLSVVLPTDTLYGLTADALNKSAVLDVYRLKNRNPSKPFIILINDVAMLSMFGVKLTSKQEGILTKLWPGPVSIILPCPDSKFEYLHRSTNSLAFRLPADKLLCDLIAKTGPLIAPSANPEGSDPAVDIGMANEYFGDQVSLYVDAGKKIAPPSTLISLLNDEVEVLRGSLATEDAVV